MRVVVDLERLRYLQCGLGQLSLHLGRSLLATHASDVDLNFLMPKETVALLGPGRMQTIEPTLWRRESLQRSLRPLMSPLARGQQCDVWHVTHQDSRFQPWDPQVPVVFTICDLNVLREKGPKSLRRRMRDYQMMIDRATAVTAISQFVADEVAEHLDLGGKSIEVIHCGATRDLDVPPVRPASLPSGPFVFTIGEINPKKNFHVLVEFLERIPGLRLVIAGSKASEYAQSIEQTVREKHLEDRIFLPGKISDGERLWLYQHCEALVFPSITEGFGLPVVEAMSHGRPVFVSQVTSLPEVAGPLGFYWQHYEPDYMARVYRAGMETFHSQADYGERLRQHAAYFNWERTARQYLALYRRVYEGTRKKAA